MHFLCHYVCDMLPYVFVIEADEDLLYDYGMRRLDWMCKTSPATSPKKKKTHSTSFEGYRQRCYCPVPGCPVRKPLKKLLNHLQQMHPSLTKEEKARMLKGQSIKPQMQDKCSSLPQHRRASLHFSMRKVRTTRESMCLGGKTERPLEPKLHPVPHHQQPLNQPPPT